MSKHRRHRWRRLVQHGQIIRVECRVCHRTPAELLDELPVVRRAIQDPIGELLREREGKRK